MLYNYFRYLNSRWSCWFLPWDRVGSVPFTRHWLCYQEITESDPFDSSRSIAGGWWYTLAPYFAVGSITARLCNALVVAITYWGLKKWTCIPMVTIFQIAPVTIKMLRTIPKDPSTQLKIAICLGGFLMSIHMKHGYAKVIGTATPPINPAKLGKNGSATAIKHAKQPNRILNPVRSHHGQGLFMQLVYLNSRLSNTGIAYIWNELRLLTTTSRLVKPRANFGVSYPWNWFKAYNIPPLDGICHGLILH